jgi:hypothetical protein
MQDGVLTLALDSPGRIIVERVGEDRIFAFAGGKQQYLHLDELKAIKVVGSAGNDNVFINPTLKTPTEMHLGAGDDVVRGSGGDDDI